MGWVKRRNGDCYYCKVMIGGRTRFICLYRYGAATDIGDEIDRLVGDLGRPDTAKQRRSKRQVDAVGEIPLLAKQNRELKLGQESAGSGKAANRDAPEPIPPERDEFMANHHEDPIADILG